MDATDTDVPQRGLTRREALKRGLAVGATLAWATPVVQAVGIRPAFAAAPSGNCVRYCLKWEPGGPSGDTCPPTASGQLPDPTALFAWTGTWSALGGKPDKTATPQGTSQDPANSEGKSEDSKGKPGEDETQGGEAAETESQPDHPPKNPPGNCLDCPEDDFAANELPGGVSLNQQVGVYGSPETGFLVTFPKAWKLAELDSGSPVAAKCGSAQSSDPSTSWCNFNYQLRTAPCEDPTRAGFWVSPCSNGHAISHIEVILDICP